MTTTGIGTAELALFAGRHATQGLPCYGAPGLHLTSAEMQQANAAYQTLSAADALAVLVCIATCCTLVAGTLRLFRQQ